MDEVLVPCAACYSRLSVTRHELLEDEALRRKISGLIEADYRGTARVLNILEWLAAVPDLESRVKVPFARQVACYYGCLLVRPAGIVKFDRPEDPQSMDRLMKRIGADAAGLGLQDRVLRRRLLRFAHRPGGQAERPDPGRRRRPRRRGDHRRLPHVPPQPGHAPAEHRKTAPGKKYKIPVIYHHPGRRPGDGHRSEEARAAAAQGPREIRAAA